MIEHCLLEAGFPANARFLESFDPAADMDRLLQAVQRAADFFKVVQETRCGAIYLKAQKRQQAAADGRTELITSVTKGEIKRRKRGREGGMNLPLVCVYFFFFFFFFFCIQGTRSFTRSSFSNCKTSP